MVHMVRYVISDKTGCTCDVAVVPVASPQGHCMYIWLLVLDILLPSSLGALVSHMALVFEMVNMWMVDFFFTWYVTNKLNTYHSMCHLTFVYCTSEKISLLCTL